MFILMLIILFFSLSWIFERNYSVSKNLISPFCYLVQNDFRISKCAGLHLMLWAWSYHSGHFTWAWELCPVFSEAVLNGDFISDSVFWFSDAAQLRTSTCSWLKSNCLCNCPYPPGKQQTLFDTLFFCTK